MQIRIYYFIPSNWKRLKNHSIGKYAFFLVKISTLFLEGNLVSHVIRYGCKDIYTLIHWSTERGEGDYFKGEGEREGEKHRCAREILISCLSDPQPGTWPATQTWARTGIEPKTSQFAGQGPTQGSTYFLTPEFPLLR